MDIKEKQARWAKEKPLFEAEFIHSHLLPFFNFNENTGDYEIKVESTPNTDKGYYCYYSELPEEGAIFLDEVIEAQEQSHDSESFK